MTRLDQILSLFSDRRGTVAIASAAALPMVVGCVALAVDIGAIYLERRTAQGIADLAAINAAAYPDHAESAARGTLSANKLSSVKELIVLKGHYDPDPGVNALMRFRPGAEPYNAVRVEIANDARLYFASAFASQAPEYRVVATAAISNSATFSVGSRLAAVRDGMLNQLTSALLGTTVNLSVMDYDALLQANVRIDDFLNAVSGELNLTGVTYKDVLDARVSMKTVAASLKAAAGRNASSQLTSALNNLAVQTQSAAGTLQLRKVLDVGQFEAVTAGGTSQGLGATLGVLDIFRTSALLAGGSRQVALDLKLQIPGVSKTTLTLAIGEPMQRSALASVGQPGSMVRTAQLKLRLVSEIGGSGALNNASLRLPIYIEAAYADARLSSVNCDAGSDNGEATVGVTPGVARALIGEIPDSVLSNPALGLNLSPAKIVSLPAAAVTGQSKISAGNTSETYLRFTDADIDAGTLHRVDTRNILASLVSSLLDNLDIKVQVLGLGIGLPTNLGSLVSTQLRAVASPLDASLYAILTSLGVHVGEADVRVHAVRCGGSSLVD